MLCIRLPGKDPALHLAAEEELLEAPAAGHEASFFLVYENAQCIVIGKNQNPWREISLSALRRGEPRFFRRISGGGAVWHGPGNLNFSFIQPQMSFSKEANLDFIRRALARRGLVLERTGRGDLLLGGKKVSGNALCYKRGRVLHHGTLLVNAPLASLAACLAPPEDRNSLKIEGRGIPSFPLPVTNLSDSVSGLDSASVADALCAQARAVFSARQIEASDFLSRKNLETRAERHSSEEWLYGESPDFFWNFSSAAGQGRLLVRRGNIADVLPPGSAAAPPSENTDASARKEALLKHFSAWLGKPFGCDVIDACA